MPVIQSLNSFDSWYHSFLFNLPAMDIEAVCCSKQKCFYARSCSFIHSFPGTVHINYIWFIFLPQKSSPTAIDSHRFSRILCANSSSETCNLIHAIKTELLIVYYCGGYLRSILLHALISGIALLIILFKRNALYWWDCYLQLSSRAELQKADTSNHTNAFYCFIFLGEYLPCFWRRCVLNFRILTAITLWMKASFSLGLVLLFK